MKRNKPLRLSISKVPDYYKILNITPSALKSNIKDSYKILAKKWHPDKNNNSKESQVKFREIKDTKKNADIKNIGNNIF